MKKNYILAFALSFAVLMVWQSYVARTHKDVPETMESPPLEPRDQQSP